MSIRKTFDDRRCLSHALVKDEKEIAAIEKVGEA
jgi:hypothetical protein